MNLKRLIWAFTGLIAVFLISLASAFPVGAINYGKVYPNTLRFGWYTTAGGSGFDTKNFGGSVNSPSIAGGIDPIQYFESMRFGGFSIRLDQNMYFLLSYKITVTSDQQKYWAYPPLVAPPSGFGDNQGGCIGTQVLDSSVTPLTSNAQSNHIEYYVNVLGRAFGNNSTQTCMNLSGQWLANYAMPDQHVNWAVYQPIISFSPDFEQLTYFELQYNSSLLYGIKEILNRGITANIDDSAIVNQQQQTTQAINDAANQAHKDNEAQLAEMKKQTDLQQQTTDFITNTETPDASDIINSDSLPSVGLLPAGPLDSLLLLPLNIMNSILSSLGGNCEPIIAPLPFSDGQNITFPCFSDTFYSGEFSVVATLVGTVGSAFILYAYFKHLYKKVDRATSLETTDEDEWGIL